jgi:hypothetical protein
MPDSVFPVSGDRGTKEILRSWMQTGGVGDYVQSGFTMSNGGALNVSVAAGVAMLQGVRVSTTDPITGALTNAATNHVFLTIDENVNDDAILVINTSGTAPATPYVKLGTVVTSGGAITTITNTFVSTPANVYGAHDRSKGRRATAWVRESPVHIHGLTTTGSASHGSALVFTRFGVSAGGSSLCYGHSTFTGHSTQAPVSVDWTAGDKLELVAKLAVPTNPGTNLVNGIELADAGTPSGSRTATSPRRIAIGRGDDGNIRLITCDGSAVTDTNLGAAPSGAFKVRLVFTRGTSVVVSINDGTETTVTTTLPSRLSNFFVGVLATTATAGTVDFYGADYKATTA